MPANIQLTKLINGGREISVDANQPLDINVLVDPSTKYNFHVAGQTVEIAPAGIFLQGQLKTLTEISAAVGVKLETITAPYPYILNVSSSPADDFKILRSLLTNKPLLNNETSEMDARISTIESELQMQRSLDEMRTQKDLLAKEIEESNKRLGSVNGLITKLNQRQAELTELKRQPIANDQQVAQARSLVLGYVRRVLTQPSGRVGQLVRAVRNYIGNMPSWPLILLAIITFIVGLAQAVIAREVMLVFIGLLSAMMQAILILLLIGSHTQVDLQSIGEKGDGQANLMNYVSPDDEGVQGYLQSIGISDLSSVFVNNALLSAYEHEIAQLNKTISVELDGKDFAVVQEEFKANEQKLTELNNKIELANQHVMTPDQYLRKRRELDMLKIEKQRSRADADNSWQRFSDQILQIANQMNINLVDKVVELAKQFNSSITELSVQGEDIMINGTAYQDVSTIISDVPELIVRLFVAVSLLLNVGEYATWPLIVSEQLIANVKAFGSLSASRHIILSK